MHKTLSALFVIGAVLGSIFDGFHTWSNTTVYASPWVLRMAWWTPPLFGAAAVAIGHGNLMMDRWLHRHAPPPTWPRVWSGLCALAVAYFASGFLPWTNAQILCAESAAAAAIWWTFDRSWQGLVTALLVAVVGCSVESMLIHLGTFRYLTPDVAGIPLWLGCLYAAGSITVGNLARTLHAPD